MPNGTICQLVKLPLVVGEQVASLTVENVTCLDEQAKKVDHIDVVVRDLEADPVFTSPTQNSSCPKATIHFGDPTCGREIRKINVQGTVHKQIYYVNKDDDVRHLGEDVDFNKTITLNPPVFVNNPQNVEIDFRDVDVNASFELPRHNRIQQVTDVSFTIKILEQTQLYALIYPNGCSPSATLGIQDEGFEDWTGNVPTNWEGVNVGPNPNGRTGQAAELGVNPTLPASLARNVPNVLAGVNYRLTFWARSIEVVGDPCKFRLVAQIKFLGADGNVLGTAEQTITAQELNNTYRQFTVNATAPEGTTSALLGLVFTPDRCNTCAALIDDLSFGQV